MLAPNSAHLSAIGRVAVQWTLLEETIEVIVWELASLKQPKAQAVTTHISTNLLIDIANAIAHESLAGTELERQLKSQLDHITNTLRPQRNKVVHGLWGTASSADKIVLMETTARGVLRSKESEEMTAEDILAIAANIDQAHFDLLHLSFAISSHLGQLAHIHIQGA